jgi:hypothetical protein
MRAQHLIARLLRMPVVSQQRWHVVFDEHDARS